MPKKNILQIGPPGSGKTGNLETLPDSVVHLSFDPGGWETLKRDIPRQGRRKRNLVGPLTTFREWAKLNQSLSPDDILVVDYSSLPVRVSVDKFQQYEIAPWNNFLMDFNEIEKIGGAPVIERRGICNVAVDSLTWMQWTILEGVVYLESRTDKGTCVNDYRIAIEKMKEIVKAFCQLPFNFILTAHVESEKDDVTGKIKEQVLIYGKNLPDLIVSMISDVYYCGVDMSTGTIRSYLYTAPQMFLKIVRQRSFDNLPIKMEADFSKLYKAGGLYCGGGEK